jgi:hypothetical protein
MARRPLGLILIGLLVVAAIGGLFFMVMQALAEFRSSAHAQSSSGLRLSVTLNSTVLRLGQSVNISIQEFNPRTQPVNISRASKWPLWGLSLGPCGTLNFPVGFAIYAGYYTQSNIFLGIPLRLYTAGTYFCPMLLSNIDYYIFQPESDTAQVFGSCVPNPCLTVPIATDMYFGGVWLTYLYVDFPPGIYTVAAGDEWGTMTLLHFVVTF